MPAKGSPSGLADSNMMIKLVLRKFYTHDCFRDIYGSMD